MGRNNRMLSDVSSQFRATADEQIERQHEVLPCLWRTDLLAGNGSSQLRKWCAGVGRQCPEAAASKDMRTVRPEDACSHGTRSLVPDVEYWLSDGEEKRTRQATERTVKGKPAEVRVPGRRKSTAKKTVAQSPRRKTTPKTKLVPMDATAETLIPKKRQQSLVAWFELYMGIEAGAPDSNTFKAKKADLQNSWTICRPQQGPTILTSGPSP